MSTDCGISMIEVLVRVAVDAEDTRYPLEASAVTSKGRSVTVSSGLAGVAAVWPKATPAAPRRRTNEGRRAEVRVMTEV